MDVSPDDQGDAGPSASRDPAPPPPSDRDEQGHWFAGRDVDVLFYRVNRRSETLFQPPADILDHLRLVLEHPRTVETGRRHKRQWRIGNKNFDSSAGVLTGMIGWARSGDALNSAWDEESQSWIDVIVPSDISAVAPFAFSADRRFVGVLKHSSFTERNIAAVLSDLLNQGEQNLPTPYTVWDVEPVGDERDFYGWVDATDQVTAVELVFKRPNPDAEEAFQSLFQRLDEHRAKQIKETITARDADEGLNKEALRTEPTTRSFISAAMSAFGYIVGFGVIRSKRVKYDQRTHVARERLGNVAPSWDGATEEVLGAVRRAERRRRGG